MTDRSPSSEQVSTAVTAALCAPLTLTAKLIEDIPDVVGRAHRHLLLARFMGRLAVNQGTEELRRRLVAGRAMTDPKEAPEHDHQSVTLVAAVPETPEEPPGPLADDLALPDYEHLPAAHVVAKLPTLSVDERDLIEEYERAHRHRRTVLGKIDQLRAAST